MRLTIGGPIKRWWRVIPGIAVTTLLAMIWVFGIGFAAPQNQGDTAKPTADQVFKNVQALKGISVDDFLGDMGIMSVALGMDCSECHVGAGTVKVDWAADTPRKITARKMVRMVEAINHDNFSGRQMVTCWSCHRGRDRPLTTPTLANVYGPVPDEADDFVAQDRGGITADKVLDKYLQAIGGVDKLAAIKSFVATGSSVGFGGFGRGGRAQIIAKFPDERATLIDFPSNPERGRSIRTFNGRDGWLETPLTILGEYQLTGGELNGAKLDAELSFPAQIKQVLTNPRATGPITISDLSESSSQAVEEGKTAANQNHVVNVVQGTSPEGVLVTLYFDQDTGYLLREVRYSKSPIGRIPTQIDFSDYRDAGGIKMPFYLTFAWLDGRDAIRLSQVQTNVSIDAAKFDKPAPLKGQ